MSEYFLPPESRNILFLQQEQCAALRLRLAECYYSDYLPPPDDAIKYVGKKAMFLCEGGTLLPNSLDGIPI